MQTKKNRVVAFLFFIAFTMCFFCINMFYNTQRITNVENRLIELDDGYIYLTIQHESNPTALDDVESTLDDFLSVYNSLNYTDKSTYYELYLQPLNVFEPEKFYNYMDETLSDTEQALCMQISENVLHDFNISLLNGRFLAGDDFVLEKDENIPVLMGFSYESIYEIGDIFEAYYLYDLYKFKVVGFLNEDCDIARSNGIIQLDKYIIMPSIIFNYTPHTTDGYASQKIHYANKTSGKLKLVPEDYIEVYETIESELKNTPVGEYSIYSSNSAMTEKIFLGMDLPTLNIMLGIVSISLVIVFAFSFALYYFRRILNKPSNYAKNHLNLKNIVPAVILLGLSNLASAGLSFIVTSNSVWIFKLFCYWNFIISIIIILVLLALNNSGIYSSLNE